MHTLIILYSKILHSLFNLSTLIYSSHITQTSLAYLNSVAAKNKDIFPNPEVFDPERWARDKPNPFAVLLFGFGPRMCYGELHELYTHHSLNLPSIQEKDLLSLN